LKDWSAIGDAAEFAEKKPRKVTVEDMPVLVVRREERFFATSNVCTHQGAPLDKGVVNLAQRTVTCPAHGSMFSLDDGRVMRPPATKSVPVYDVKVQNGVVFIRPTNSRL